MNVTMEDGTIINDVPDGTTKSQLMSKYQKVSTVNEMVNPAMAKSMETAAPSVPGLQAGPKNPPGLPPQPQQPPNFMQRVGQDVQKRVGMAQDIKANAGAQPIGETALQAVGGVGAGLMGDIAGEAAKSAYGALPENIRKNIEADPITKMGVSMAQKGADVYGKWAQQNPRAAKDVEAAVNIASLFPVPSAKLAGKAVEGAVSPVTNIVKGAIAPSAEKMAKITDVMHKTATATIEKAKNSGVVFDTSAGKQLTDKLDADPDLKTAGESSVRPLTAQAIADIKKSVDSGDTTLRNLLGFRDKLTTIVNKGGQDAEAARKARTVLDSTIEDGKVAAGNPKDTALVKYFRSQWGRYKTGEQVASAAELASTSSAKSRAAFQKIVDSKFFSSLSPEVQRLSKIAAKGKASGKFLDTVGSIKNLLGASMGKHLPLLEAGGAVMSGHPSVAGAIGGVMAAGAGGKAVQRGVGADVLRALQENK